MPAETHPRGLSIGHDEVVVLLSALLGEAALDAPDDTTLSSLGVDEFGVGDLWDAVREEFGERSLGPADAAEELDPAMTISTAAITMARLLARERDDRAG